jgi:hypothetical protein
MLLLVVLYNYDKATPQKNVEPHPSSVWTEPHVLGTHSDGEEGKTDATFETKG